MWIFTSGGLIMPAQAPNGTTEGIADPTFTNNGEYTLQVRGRVESHLRNFMRDYMDPQGLPYSEIEHTPQNDYNMRFYTTHEAFAKAMVLAVMDIDYRKFKPTAEKKDANGRLVYEDGRKYHSVLNSIWGSVCGLATPGGIWGPRTAENPKGYGRAQDHWIGSSFLDAAEDLDLDYVPNDASLREELLAEMSDIPVEQWEDYLSLTEMELVKDVVEEHERKEARRQAKIEKRARRNYRRGRKQRA